MFFNFVGMNEHSYKLPKIICESEFELMKQMVYLYSSFMVIKGHVRRPLKPRLVEVLAMYILLGYSKEVKREILRKCNLKNEADLNCLNKELRDQNYLVKGKLNERNNELSESLKNLGLYHQAVKKLKPGSDLNMNFNFIFNQNEKGLGV